MMLHIKKQKVKKREEKDMKREEDDEDKDWKASAQRQSHEEELRNNPPPSFGEKQPGSANETEVWPDRVVNLAKRLGHSFKGFEFEFKVPGKRPFYGFEPADETRYRPLRYTCLGFAFGTYDIATDRGYSIMTSYILRVLGNNDDWTSVATCRKNDGFVNIEGGVRVVPNDVIVFIKNSPPGLQISSEIGFHAVVVKNPVKLPGGQYYNLSKTVVVDKPGELPLVERSLEEALHQYRADFHSVQIWRRRDGVYRPNNLQSFEIMPATLHDGNVGKKEN